MGRSLDKEYSIGIRFKRLFIISQHQDGFVSEIQIWEDMRIYWDLGWRRPFFVHEEPLISALILVFQEFQFSGDIDRWIWRHFKYFIFFVESMYYIQLSLYPPREVHLVMENTTLRLICDNFTLSKMAVFS